MWRIGLAPNNASKWQMGFNSAFDPLNAELNPICHLLALLGAHHIPHVSRIRVKRTFTWPWETQQSAVWLLQWRNVSRPTEAIECCGFIRAISLLYFSH